jgi:hypothetical protein
MPPLVLALLLGGTRPEISMPGKKNNIKRQTNALTIAKG